MRAHVDGTQAHGFDSCHLVPTPVTLCCLRIGAVEAEDVFAGDHATVDENGLEALIAAMDHGIDDLK